MMEFDLWLCLESELCFENGDSAQNAMNKRPHLPFPEICYQKSSPVITW